jgi:hypothetical protein
MDQSGKVFLFSSVTLSLAVLLGMSALLARHDASWSRLAPIAALMPPPPDPVVVAAAEMAKLMAGPDPAPAAGRPEGGPAAPPADHWSEAEVDAALMECVRLLGPTTAEVISLAPIRANDCGTPAPVLLRSLGGTDKVVVDPPLLTNCPMVAALSRWMEQTVQSPGSSARPMPAATSTTFPMHGGASTLSPTPSIFRCFCSPTAAGSI